MLIVAESDIVKCKAVVGYDEQNTIIVFHPSLTETERDQYARELLTEGEIALWEERLRAAG